MQSNRVCVDANFVVRLLLPSETYSSEADALRREWLSGGVDMIVPHLFHAEVASSLRKYVHFKKILPEQGERAFAIYLDIPVKTIQGPQLYRRAWELAREFNLPVCYDMQYLAAAEMEDCELWTADRALVNSLRGRAKRVRWLGDFRAGQ